MDSSKQPGITKQVFYGAVDNVAGRDVVNHIHHDQGRALTGQERVELNDKVKRLHEQYGEHGGRTWKFLHRTIGVENIEAMRLGHRDSAHAILDLLLDRAERQRQGTVQSVELDANAGAMTKMVQQVSTLSAQLKSSKTLEQQYQRQYGDAQRQLEQHQRQLGEAQSQIELLRQSRSARPLCQTCSAATQKLAHTRRGLIIASVVAILGCLAAALLAYETYDANKAAQAAEARLQVCEHDSKVYRLGSVIDNPKAADLRCVVDGPGQAAHWQEIPAPKQANARPSSRPRQDRTTPKRKRDHQEQKQEASAATTSVDVKELLF